MTLREEVEKYIFDWTPTDSRVASPCEKEVRLFSGLLRELDESLRKLKEMKSLAGKWQDKYSDCKKEVTILRTRKTFYKKEFLKMRKLIGEADEYLDTNKMTNIMSRSTLHIMFKAALAQPTSGIESAPRPSPQHPEVERNEPQPCRVD